MKVLIISSTVSDSISVGKIATQLELNLIQNGIESKVLFFCNGEKSNTHRLVVPKVITRLHSIVSEKTNFLIDNSFIQIRNIKRNIKKFEPDVIHIIQPLPAYISIVGLFKMLGKTGIPCVYSMIDENPYLGNCDNAYDCKVFLEGCHNCVGDNFKINVLDYKGKWNEKACRRIALKKKQAYDLIDNICYIAPEWVIKRAKESYLLNSKKMYIVDEYVDTENLYYPRRIDKKMMSEYGIDVNKIVILNIAKYSNVRKGVELYIELARRFEEDSNYLFVNIGYDGDNMDLPANFIAIPFVKDQEKLAMFYSASDLYMITSMSDTMPNVCLEALSCGTPVCGFNITGIPYVADEPIGQFVEPFNINKLETIVRNLRKKNKEQSDQCRLYAEERYSPKICVGNIINIYQEMLEKSDF